MVSLLKGFPKLRRVKERVPKNEGGKTNWGGARGKETKEEEYIMQDIGVVGSQRQIHHAKFSSANP